MKKLFFFLAFVAMNVFSFGQNQLVWLNGKLLYGTPIESIDSMTYNEMQDVDTLHLLLPSALVKRDTVINYVYIHDTIYMDVDCGDAMKGHEFVDLGLSVFWATCNVGASKPEEYGDYFAWGEVEPKTKYTCGNYKWGCDYDMTKYETEPASVSLLPEDDAAVVNWGGAWRMPDMGELYELQNRCTWKSTTQNGVKGYQVIGPNGNSIFLPAAGYRDGMSLLEAGNNGHYWSRYREDNFFDDAEELSIVSGMFHYWVRRDRYYGYSVRPVCP